VSRSLRITSRTRGPTPVLFSESIDFAGLARAGFLGQGSVCSTDPNRRDGAGDRATQPRIPDRASEEGVWVSADGSQGAAGRTDARVRQAATINGQERALGVIEAEFWAPARFRALAGGDPRSASESVVPGVFRDPLPGPPSFGKRFACR